MSGYQPMYGRTDRPLPDGNYKKLSQDESLDACYQYHKKQVYDALRNDALHNKPVSNEVWLNNQKIVDPNGAFGFNIQPIIITRGSFDSGFIVKNYGGTDDITWKPAEEVRTPVKWNYNEGMWSKYE